MAIQTHSCVTPAAAAAAAALPTITLPSNMDRTAVFALSAHAGWKFPVNGRLQHVENQSLTWQNFGTEGQGFWMRPLDADAGLFQIRVDVNSGNFTFGSSATGTWLDMDTERLWYRSQTTVGSSVVNFDLQIRNKATTDVIVSRTGIVLTVFRTS